MQRIVSLILVYLLTLIGITSLILLTNQSCLCNEQCSETAPATASQLQEITSAYRVNSPPIVVDSPATRFAVIGDYGSSSQAEQDVADLVKSWQPDFIITVGDNNYRNGEASTIDRNVGQFYGDYIYPYLGSYETNTDLETNRFFPTLGNHDWGTTNARPHFDYFTLPGNERYYDFIWGPVHLFAIDSNKQEPDGITQDSPQATWLRDTLATSTAPWKIVYLHHPPYSSGRHGSTRKLQWPFQEWGATAVLAGHDHDYERIELDGIPYFTNGLGGKGIRAFSLFPIRDSKVRYNNNYGAMLIKATASNLVIEFYAITGGGQLIDRYTLTKQQ